MNLIIKNLREVHTFNDQKEVFKSSNIVIVNGVIKYIGSDISNFNEVDFQVLDGSSLVALPGFVNTHHHFYQTLFRGISEAQELPLFPWLKTLYEFWKYLDDESVYLGSQVAMAELLKTGCTFSSDHHYVFPKDVKSTLIDTQFEVSKLMGMRFTATRGSMSLGVDQGGLPPMKVVQSEEEILEDSLRLIKKYHNREKYAMNNIALAPCSPFSVTNSLMVKSRELSDKYGVMLHTHLAETMDEERFCLEKYGKTPYELMESVGWTGENVWFAHGIYFSPAEMVRLKGSGIAHCPSSNMKLNSGICPLIELKDSGVKLSIAVDGSASNDGSNMWEEIRRAYLLNHLKYGTKSLNAYEILRMATRGGAEVLGRSDVGYLDVGMAGDLILLDLNGVEYAGCHDTLVSIVTLGNSSIVKTTIVNGEVVVQDGKLVKVDERKIREEAHGHATRLVATKRKIEG